ncbi:uncharacterized protein LOC132194957 [Neocloeon triangulifer]|uniref:uncharacterized protein LOC132194957 n=1 Tax=Neocloeon triangulifer TaxID=2078957 RepID=UPI00286F788D|nr:uncharacterized protein LOC132194957 [Neocloeon triangulifer]
MGSEKFVFLGLVLLAILLVSTAAPDNLTEESSNVTSEGPKGANSTTPGPPRSGQRSLGSCTPGCLRCEVSGCFKCAGVIVHGSRECRAECPPGYRQQWSSLVDYMGLLCIESTMVGAGWLGGWVTGGQELTVLIGVACGSMLCVLVLAAACGFVTYRRAKMRRSPVAPAIRSSRCDPPAMGQSAASQQQWLTPQELQLRREFAKQVGALRPEAPVFLAMLNDTRRKVRELYRPNGTDSRSKAYRTVLRDLTRILTLLNRKEARLGAPPPDWDTLLDWAERSLRRYKKSVSNEGVGSACGSGATSSSASSTPTSSHALNQHHPNYGGPDGNLSDNEDTKGCESIEIPALLQNASEWSQNSLYFYESYYPLGFRPQDEITTEL